MKEERTEEPLRQEVIRRPRVNALLERAVPVGTVLLYAGSGFGKTRAVANYLGQTEFRVVRMQLSDLDNLPDQFWRHFIAAVKPHRPALAAKMEALGFPDTRHSFSAFLSDLTEELYRDVKFVAFLFDDLHLLQEASVLAFIGSMVSTRMENSVIFLLTRSWPLGGIELPAQAEIITGELLRFTRQEAVELFRRYGSTRSEEQVGELCDYVSGWPMALSLSAMLQARSGEEADDGPGTKLALHELFEERVFSQYTEKERKLLIQLSVMESFPRGLVQAVTGEQGRDLRPLLGGNSFIRYDAQEKRLSFQPLYREFLQVKLVAFSPREISETLREAGLWCRENGFLYDAALYLERSGCEEELWETVQRFDANRHTRAEARFLLNIITGLSGDFRAKNPMTFLVEATLQVNNLHFGEAREALDRALPLLEALPAGREKDRLLGEYYTAEGLFTLGIEQNGFEEWFRRAAALLPEGSGRWGRRLRLVDMGPGVNLHDDAPGGLDRSLSCYMEGVPHLVKVLHGAGMGMDQLARCEADFLVGDLKSSEQAAYKALYDAQQTEQLDIVGNALFILLRVQNINGKFEGVRDTLARIDHFQGQEQGKNLGIWDVARGWFLSEMEAVSQVAEWILGGARNSQPPISQNREFLIKVRCLIALGRDSEALAILDFHEAGVRKRSGVIAMVYICLYRAVIHHRLREYAAALEQLRQAYGFAKGNRIIMPFIEYGNRTRTLLERARSAADSGIPAEWLEQVHARASTFAKRHVHMVAQYQKEFGGEQKTYDLTKRELAMLADLSQGLTREEIAAGMQLSLNTVKSTLKQIFSKLGAINSNDAIRIAISAGLLS